MLIAWKKKAGIGQSDVSQVIHSKEESQRLARRLMGMEDMNYFISLQIPKKTYSVLCNSFTWN